MFKRLMTTSPFILLLGSSEIFPYDCCGEMLLSDTTAPRLFGTTSTRAFTAGSTGHNTVL